MSNSDVKLQVDAIPAELRERCQWVPWRHETRNGKRTKIPYNAKTLRMASATDPQHWATFEVALDALNGNGKRFDGVGYVFSADDPYTGIDLDDCLGPDGKPYPEAQATIDRLGGYTEVSPSGKGVKVWVKGTKPGDRCRKKMKWDDTHAGEIEIYDTARYFTVTGDRLAGTPDTIRDAQNELDTLYKEVFGPPKESCVSEDVPVGLEVLRLFSGNGKGFDGTDENLLDIARQARNGEKFSVLFDHGDLSAYPGKDGQPDHSAADFALLSHLIFYCGKDHVRIDRLFRQSALMRPKWAKKRGDTTYGAASIAKAIGSYRGEFFVESSKISKISRGTAQKTVFEPLPLRREPPPPKSFPINALGDILAPATQKLHEIVQAPDALCGQSVLGTAALAVQGHANVVIDGREMPISVFLITVGISGERKTGVDTESLKPVRAYERQLVDQYDIDRRAYEREKDAYDSAYRETLRNKKDREAKTKALMAVGDPPKPPLVPILLVEEPTYEGLIKLLIVGQPAIGVFADEGGRIIGGHAMNAENQLKTLAGLSELWDGKRISRVRVGEGNAVLYGRRVSLHLMLQPMVAEMVMSNRLMDDQGFLSRTLVAWPTSTAGTRAYREIDLTQEPEMKRYNEKILSILQVPLPLVRGTSNELEPRLLPLSPEAKELWIEFHNLVEVQLADEQPLAMIRGFGSKAAEHAARIGGILTLVEDLQAAAIPLQKMAAGIELSQYYLEERLRLVHAGMADPDIVLAEKLLEWAPNQKDRVVCLRDIYQKGPSGIRDAKTARRIVAVLEKHGWFVPVPGGMQIDGDLRREVWKVR